MKYDKYCYQEAGFKNKKNDTQKANIFYKKLIYFTTEKSSWNPIWLLDEFPNIDGCGIIYEAPINKKVTPCLFLPFFSW